MGTELSPHRQRAGLQLLVGLVAIAGLPAVRAEAATPAYAHLPELSALRDPVAVVLAADGSRAWVAGRESDNVALVDLSTRAVLAYVPVGNQPVALALSPGGEILAVVNELSPYLSIIDTASRQVVAEPRAALYGQGAVFRDFIPGLPQPPDPIEAILNPQLLRLYVSNRYLDQVQLYTGWSQGPTQSVTVGWNPGPLRLDPEGRLWVSNLLQGTLDVIDPLSMTLLAEDVNLGAPPRDLWAFGPWMLASLVSSDDAGDEILSEFGNLVGAVDRTTFSVTVVDLDAIAAPTPVAVPTGLAGNGDASMLLVALEGSNRLLAYLPASHMSLHFATGAAPAALAFHESSLTAVTANRVDNSLSIVDLATSSVTHVALGPPPDPNDPLALGRLVFFDATKSFPTAPQMSCSSCHPGFHLDGRSRMEFGRPRQVLSAFNTGAGKTNPALSKGVVSMEELFGDPAIADPGLPLTQFVNSLEDPPSPFARPDGTLTPAGFRGRDIFFGLDPAAPPLGCVNCHTPPFYSSNIVENFSDTNPDTVNVGTSVHVIPPGQGGGTKRDGINIPSLLGLWDSQPYLSDGRYKTLTELLESIDYTRIDHNFSGMIHGNDDNDPGYSRSLVRDLTPQQFDDLRTFLLSLSAQTLFDTPAGVGGGHDSGSRALFAEPTPNPFFHTTTVAYQLTRPGAVRLRIFDAAGRLVRTLVEAGRPAGPHEVTWDGLDISGREVRDGVYFIRLESPDTRRVRKVVKRG